MQLPIHSRFSSSLLAIGLALSVALGPLVQPAAAQPATPTPAPGVVPIGTVTLSAPVQTTPTLQPITVIQSTGSLVVVPVNGTPVPTTGGTGCLAGIGCNAPPITISSCGGASRIFQGCPIDGPTELSFESQAIGTLLQKYQLPASDHDRVLAWARDDVRAAMFNNLVASFQKDPNSRTAQETTAVNALTKVAQQKHIQIATVAQNEYNKWAYNPCGYTPPAGFKYDASSACASATSRIFTPPSPGLEALDAYGVLAAYQGVQNDPSAQAVSAGTAGALLLGYGYAAAVGAGAVGAIVGAFVPASIVGVIHPFLATALAAEAGLTATLETGTAVSSGAAAAEAGAVLPAGLVGAISIGGSVLIVVGAVVTIVVAGIEVFHEAAIPGQLQAALSAAQTYDIGAALRSTDAGTSASANQELYGEFLAMTLPDFPTTSSVPAPQPGDPQIVVNGTPTSSMTYSAWDNSKHTVRRSSGWFVDTDAKGKSSLTLSIDYLDPTGKGWIVSPVGSQYLLVDPGNPTSATYPQPRLIAALPPVAPVSSDVRLVDMNQTGSGKTEVHILTAGSNYEQWSIETGTALDMSSANQWAFAFAPNADLYAIKLNNTASGHTEVHILSAASKYQQYSLETATPFGEADPSNWTYQVGANGDLYAITTRNSGSGKVEVHILTAASKFQQFSNEVATALGAVDPTRWEFHLTAANDLVGVFLNGTGSGQTEVHILSAASNYQQCRLEVPTALGPTDRANWQFRMGANDDLLGIFLNGTHSGTTEVHRLSASANYRQFDLEVPSALHQDGPGFWNFGVGSLVY